MTYLRVISVGIGVCSSMVICQAVLADTAEQFRASVCASAAKEMRDGTNVPEYIKVNCKSLWMHRDRSAAAQTSGHPAATPTGPVQNPLPDDNFSQRVFLRADPMDNFWYTTVPGGLNSTKGASINYTNDRDAQTQKAMVAGQISYLLVPPNNTDLNTWGDFALATWFLADGTWNEPLKKPENSTFKAGFDGQVRFITADPVSQNPYQKWDLYFGVSPYLQTDFRQVERAGGVKLAAEARIPELYLDYGKANYPINYILAFWNFRPEADFREVANPGFTSQVKGTYSWFGYSARGTVDFLPLPTGNLWVDQWLVNRFVLIGTAQYYWDANSPSGNPTNASPPREVRYYTAQLQYNLGSCSFPKTVEIGVYPDCVIAGDSSISFEYDVGTNKDTLVHAKQYLVKLSFKH
jgi:hypothetical protein